MSVHIDADGVIILEGVCPVEDAEALLQLLQATPDATCDWTRCSRLHTTVVQILLVARPRLVGPCGDTWFEQWFGNHFARRGAEP